jgi:predicted flavoprotein YhiN
MGLPDSSSTPPSGPRARRNSWWQRAGCRCPKIGATDFGHRLARQFGLRVVDTRPGLVPLTFDGEGWAPYAGLAGLALPVGIETGSGRGRGAFVEDLLFTHRGLSGPAVLQISSYWQPGTPIVLDLAPGTDLLAALTRAKATSRRRVVNELATLMPSRLADAWVQRDADWQRPVAEVSNKALARLADRLARWSLVPVGTEGYRKAEVTLGGVDTRDLSSRTMESEAARPVFHRRGGRRDRLARVATTSSGPGPVRQHAPTGWQSPCIHSRIAVFAGKPRVDSPAWQVRNC